MNRTLGAPAALGEIIKVWLNVTAFVLHVLYHNHSPQKTNKIQAAWRKPASISNKQQLKKHFFQIHLLAEKLLNIN